MTELLTNTAPIDEAFQEAAARLSALGFADALWSRRLDVWPGDAAVRERISQRLGWLDAVDFTSRHVERLRAVAQSIRDAQFSDVVLLGMGGSSLAPEVMRRCLGQSPGWPRFRVLDSVNPEAVRDAFATAPTSLFVLASKSGSTIEPNTMAAEARNRLQAAGIVNWAERFVAITDEGTPAHHHAQEERFREIFVNPSDIGGRYSALSYFGMVPAALMGLDVDALLREARVMEAACRRPEPLANPGLMLGAFMAAAATAGRDKLTLLLPERFLSFGLWVEQLVAESTGKDGRGVVPIVGEAPGTRFGHDRAAVVLTVAGDGPEDAERVTRAEAPSLGVQMAHAEALGAEFLRWEVATATAGLLLGINPFDEPNVQQAKDATRTLLQVYTTQRRLPLPEADAQLEGVRLTLSNAARDQLNGREARHFLSLVSPGDYVALLAYLPPDAPAWEAEIVRSRVSISAATGAATMFGYGPRYLHSTGQLHKGGANNGVFIVITADLGDDLAIPGQSFSFGVLEMAQALGDFQSLERTGRRALHLHLPRRDTSLLDHLTRLLTGHLG